MLSPWHGFPMAQMRPHNGMQTTSHFHTWCNHSNKRPHQIEKRFERVTGEMFTLLQHRFWLQLDNVSRISISCNSCIRHCHHISKCFLFEWIKVCATALQEWWCLRWLDIDSGPQFVFVCVFVFVFLVVFGLLLYRSDDVYVGST